MADDNGNGNGKIGWAAVAKVFGAVLLTVLVWLGGLLWADVQDLKDYRVDHTIWSNNTLRDIMDSIRVVRTDVVDAVEDSRDSILKEMRNGKR
jgi:hypothetical protein